MKHYKLFLLILLLSISFIGCSNEEINIVEENELLNDYIADFQ